MPICCPPNIEICGVTLYNFVGYAFCHFVIHGIFVTAFVFSNSCYPPMYYIDYFYGITGAVLIAVAIIGLIIASLKFWQLLRSLWALIVVINVLTVIVAALYYTIVRWDDVMVTAFIRALRRPEYKDFHDNLWYASTVIACIMTLPFLLYLICIISFMCNERKSIMFTAAYTRDDAPIISVPQIPQSGNYPTQR